jgi:Restriction endonuclease
VNRRRNPKAFATHRISAPRSPALSVRLSADEVKQAVAEHFQGMGFQVQVARGRVRGTDIVATRGEERWIIEAKDEVADSRLSPPLLCSIQFCRTRTIEFKLHQCK